MFLIIFNVSNIKYFILINFNYYFPYFTGTEIVLQRGKSTLGSITKWWSQISKSQVAEVWIKPYFLI